MSGGVSGRAGLLRKGPLFSGCPDCLPRRTHRPLPPCRPACLLACLTGASPCLVPALVPDLPLYPASCLAWSLSLYLSVYRPLSVYLNYLSISVSLLYACPPSLSLSVCLAAFSASLSVSLPVYSALLSPSCLTWCSPGSCRACPWCLPGG